MSDQHVRYAQGLLIAEARRIGWDDDRIQRSIRSALALSVPPPPETASLRHDVRRVYEFWIAYEAENRIPPTIREAMNALQVSSTSVMSYRLEKLTAAGLLHKCHGHRGYRLPHPR